ncbi:MAG: hypothetical protein Q8R55_06865 [Candidatus Taylorbacteria bacterium]|nr:hypothetical protein [Candidatus Taylorbacteria bacterium]
MRGWEVKQLLTFEADLEKYQLPTEKWEKWLNVFKQAPMTIKNAHNLQGPLKPLWSAHLTTAQGLLLVIYAVCNGDEGACFLKRGIEKHISPLDVVQHTCSKETGNVFLYKILPKHEYSILT